MLLLLLNPKAWSAALSASASFAALAADPVRLALILGAAFGLGAALSLVMWCMTGMLLGRILRSERHWRRVNRCLGLLLALAIMQIWVD